MRRLRWLVLAALAVVAAAPASSAQAMIVSPPLVHPPEITCGWCPEGSAAATREVNAWTQMAENVVDEWYRSVDAGTPEDRLPEGSVMRRSAMVAYGTGTTHCVISADKYPGSTYHDFEGITKCNARIRQTAQMWVTGPSGSVSGMVCDGWQYTCRSAGDAFGDFDDVRFVVKLIAPLGQGWIASPAECSGAGTDNLTCTF